MGARTRLERMRPHYEDIIAVTPMQPPIPAPLKDVSRTPATPAVAKALTRLQCWPGEQCVAVGLSGGVDSSLSAALLVEAD